MFLFATLLLAACGHSDAADPGPGGVAREDARVLDEAAASLDQRVAQPHAHQATRRAS